MATIAGRLNLLSPKRACLLLIVIWAYAFWPTIIKACNAYLHSGFDYQGMLVLPIFLLITNHNSANLKRASIGYNPLGLLYLILCAALWLVATVVELDLPRQIAIIGMLISIVSTTCGRKITSILFLPLACLFLLLPIGQQINTAIHQSLTWLVMQGLMIFKQPVYWEANKIFANNYAYDIHPYLRGLQYALPYLAIGAGYAMLCTRAITRAISIAGCFVFIPFIILWLSLYCYIMLNQWFIMNNLLANHPISIGWSLTILGLLLSICVGFLLADKRNCIAKNYDIDWRDGYFNVGKRPLKPILMASCIMLLAPLLAHQLKNINSYNDATLPNMPSTIAQWKRPAPEAMKSTSLARFHKEKKQVSLAISHQDQQLDPSWEIIKESTKKIKLTKIKLPIYETILHGEKNKYKINWKINYVNGHFTANKTVAKALTQIYSLSAQNIKSGIITMSTDATSELNSARDRLKEFLQDFTECSAITEQKIVG